MSDAEKHLQFIEHLQQAGESAAAIEEFGEALRQMVGAALAAGQLTPEMLREVLNGLPDHEGAQQIAGDLRREFLSSAPLHPSPHGP